MAQGEILGHPFNPKVGIALYCRCGNRNGYKAARPDPPKGEWDLNYDYWVCADCLAPSRLVFIGLTNSLAPKRATALLSVVGDGAGFSTLRWSTQVSGERIVTMSFNPYPRRHPDMHATDQGRSILLDLWKKLDDYIDIIRDPATLPDTSTNFYQPRASELADVLAMLMKPFYASSTAVLQESMARWTARQEGRIDSHETPGLAEHLWDPKPPVTAGAAAKRSSPGKATPVVLDEAKQNFIKLQLDTGAFPKEELAKMFQVSVEVIQHNYDLRNAAS